jgi:hypothetical protein
MLNKSMIESWNWLLCYSDKQMTSNGAWTLLTWCEPHVMIFKPTTAKSIGWYKTLGSLAPGWSTLVLRTGVLAYRQTISMCARSSGWEITLGKK